MIRRLAVLAAAAFLLIPATPTSAETLPAEAIEFLEWHHANFVEVLPGVWAPRAEAEAIQAFLAQARRDAYAPALDCISSHESATSGNYTAVSPNGAWRGRYQFAAGTGRFSVGRAGHGEWAGIPANQWPAHVQDDAAIALIEHQGGRVQPAWRWSDCNRLLP